MQFVCKCVKEEGVLDVCAEWTILSCEAVTVGRLGDCEEAPVGKGDSSGSDKKGWCSLGWGWGGVERRVV